MRAGKVFPAAWDTSSGDCIGAAGVGAGAGTGAGAGAFSMASETLSMVTV
jgi:hypothetical protein